ncbi:MAG TPA: YhcH/YjgK/YiaL family protein [Verrucomicrobiae bacterium]|jgi:YhcH/YjgK/YiaL family protein|nr:YhcH/YjgK/YiaL family protein [Verrucomicrobiae bacterium]
MIYGNLLHPDAFEFLKTSPTWRDAFNWLKTLSSNTPVGVTELDGDRIYASVQRYDTLPAVQCRYESHRRYVDLQYCIGGGEIIDCCFSSELTTDGDFNEKKDVQFYLPSPKGIPVRMSPGCFTVFFPSDAHAPKRRDEVNSTVHKVVLKIDRAVIPPQNGSVLET